MFQAICEYYTKNGKELVQKVEKRDTYSAAEDIARKMSIQYGKAYLVSGQMIQIKEEFRNGEYVENDNGYLY